MLGEHCSYCIPAGKTEVFGPNTSEQHLAEICWLLQEIGYTTRRYWELIDQLRNQYEKINGRKPRDWYEVFYSRDASREEMEERSRRIKQWKSNRS